MLIAYEYLRNASEKNQAIKEKGPVLHIIQIVVDPRLQLLRGFDQASMAVYLSPTCHPRFNFVS